MSGPLTDPRNTSRTIFDTVTFDDTPQVALSANTDCEYFVLNNKTTKEVNVTVAGTGDAYILDDNDTLLLHGDPSQYSVFNNTDAVSVSIVYAIHTHR